MTYDNINIKADEKALNQVLRRKAVYKVPPYQRRFGWGDEQFKDLWSDIKQGLANQRLHSMGEIKLVPRHDDDPTTLQIIDGQQRLTTLATLICALRDEYERRDSDRKYIRQLQRLLHTEDRDANKVRSLQLLDARGDDEVYEHIYSGVGDIEDVDGGIAAAYEFFSSRFGDVSEKRLNQLRKYVIEGLSFIRTEVDDLDQAFIIFETQNRGLELDKLERAKAIIMRTAHHRADDSISDIQRVWTKIIRASESADDVNRRPIRHVLLVTGDWPVSPQASTRQRGFVDNMTRVIESVDGSVEEYLWGLNEHVQHFEQIMNGRVARYADADNSKLNSLVNQCTEQNPRASLPVYWLFENINNVDELTAALDEISRLSLRMHLDDLTASKKRDATLNIYRQLASGTSASEAAANIAKRFTDSDRALEIKLQNRSFSTNKLLRYILYRVEAANFGGNATNGSVHPTAAQDMDIEHIAPLRAFSAKKYSRWRPHLGHDEERFNKCRKRLGNLTLLRSRQNEAANSDPFEQKLPKYRASDFAMSQTVADKYDSWSFEQIEERTKRLARLTVQTFSFDRSRHKHTEESDKPDDLLQFTHDS